MLSRQRKFLTNGRSFLNFHSGLIENLWSLLICLKTEVYLSQILLGPFLNALSYSIICFGQTKKYSADFIIKTVINLTIDWNYLIDHQIEIQDMASLNHFRGKINMEFYIWRWVLLHVNQSTIRHIYTNQVHIQSTLYS